MNINSKDMAIKVKFDKLEQLNEKLITDIRDGFAKYIKDEKKVRNNT